MTDPEISAPTPAVKPLTPSPGARAIAEVRERYKLVDQEGWGFVRLKAESQAGAVFTGTTDECQAWLDEQAAKACHEARWQPIETAPKDGTEFLSFGAVGSDNRSYPTKWCAPGPYSTENGKNAQGERRYQYPDGFYWAGYDGFVGPVEPTDWMPLPEPPTIRAVCQGEW